MARTGMIRVALVTLAGSALLVEVAPCQSQYPAGQNPPPGQYPPNSYPDNYPVRLPGGVPVGVPIPQIKLPKKKDKAEPKNAPAPNSDLKMSLRAIDGTLRELAEKELYLDAGSKRLFRFRLLAKTQFRNKQGEAVRDSLLKPGDQLTVQVNANDPETALRVIIARTGTADERAAAAKPFDRASANAPGEEDTKPAGSIEIADSGSGRTGAANEPAESASPDGRPSLSSREPGEPGTVRTAGSGQSNEIIEAARTRAESYTSEMPNFLVQQVTTRFVSNSIPAVWKTMDQVEAEVACVNGKEEYRNIRVNGRPTAQPVEKTGAWSTGEFVTTLQDVLSYATAASFTNRLEVTVVNRPAYLYDFVVQQSNSHWVIVSPAGRSYAPAYNGAIWIDKETKQVLKIEQRTSSLPADFPFTSAESILEYDFVRIDARPFLLPVHSENLTCERASLNCWRNEIAFRNYKKFSSDSNIVFTKLRQAE